MYEWMEGLLVIQWCQLLSGTEVNAHCWHQSHAVGWIQCTGICTFVVNPVVIGCGFGSHFCSPKISTYIGKFCVNSGLNKYNILGSFWILRTSETILG